MDDEKKEQIISAIYIAISHGNYRCASSILDDTTAQVINKTLDQAIALVEKDNQKLLCEKIRQLKI